MIYTDKLFFRKMLCAIKQIANIYIYIHGNVSTWNNPMLSVITKFLNKVMFGKLARVALKRNLSFPHGNQ